MENTSTRTTSDWPDDWWRDRAVCEILLGEFKSRLLGLLVIFEVDGVEQKILYSGFLARYEGVYFWFTASHVVKEVEELRASPTIAIKAMRWWDNCEIPGAETVPVHDLDFASITSPSDLLDFGAIRLNILEVLNILRAGGVKPFEPYAQIESPEHNPDGYYLVGWSAKDVVSGPTPHQVSASISCIPLERLDHDTSSREGQFWSDPTAFYATILPFAGMKDLPDVDVRGMSGGPILSICRDVEKGFVYRLTAIQRSWDPRKKHIRAEPLEKIIPAT